MQEQNHIVSLGARKSVIMIPIVIGVSLILCTAIGAYAFYKIRLADDSLSVTGSAKREIVSDTVRWTPDFSREVKESAIKAGYAQMAEDEKNVLEFLKSKGVKPEEIVTQPVSMMEVYDYNPQGVTPREKRYTLTEDITINSKDVELITSVAKDTQQIINKGIIFSNGLIEYSYSKLPELRVELLTDAVKDAKARAEKIASAGNMTLGVLKSASSGVVQVLPLNSVDVQDGGAYSTSDIKKEVMVTVKASFTIR